MKTLMSLLLFLLILITSAFAETINIPEQFPFISDAIIEAKTGDTILVAPGIYYENIDFSGKDIVIASHYLLTNNPGYINTTIISGQRLDPDKADIGTVVTFQSQETNAAQLIGFTIKDGFGTLIGDIFKGGGIICRNNSHPTISHNIIKFNNALEGGGCMFLDSDPIFNYNLVDSNNAAKGGGISLDNSHLKMDHCVFAYNHASEQGGAVFILLSDNPRITNSVFYKNNSAFVGGIGCFFAFPEISYNNFYDNTGGNFGDCVNGLGDTTCCQNFNRIPCDNYFNIYCDPLFRNPAAHDFTPSLESPLIDAASVPNPNCPQNGIYYDIGLFEASYLVGDCNQDNIFNISDIVFLINYIYYNGPAPEPIYSGDFSQDRRANIVDVQVMLLYIFNDGVDPCGTLE